MRPSPTAPPRRTRGPSPSQAGANLLIHDLKNLAGRLAALQQNLDRHYQDPLFKHSALLVLDDTVLHLRRLAGDLREHEGRVLLKLRINLNQVLEEAVLQTRPDLAGRVELWEEYDPLPTMWGDSYLLRNAFACAMENSLQAMRGHGILAVRTRRIRRNARIRLLVEIADDGPGMSPEFLKNSLVRPFASTKEDGLGLGVYTMQQVATLHGATLRIASRKKVGTRVRFHFPAEEARQ